MHRDAWRDFGYALDRFKRSLEDLSYSGAFSTPKKRLTSGFFTVVESTNSVSVNAATSILKQPTLQFLHGYELLKAVPVPKFPEFPARPVEKASAQYKYTVERAASLEDQAIKLKEQFDKQFSAEAEQLGSLRDACLASDPAAIRLLMIISHLRHELPLALRLAFETEVDVNSRVALCTIDIPDFSALSVVKPGGRNNNQVKSVSASEKGRVLELMLYSLCLRAAFLVARSDCGNWFDSVAVNAMQSWFDEATGKPMTGVIASLQAQKVEVIQLNLTQVDPKACFRYLKGIATPSVERIAPIRPIFVINTDDNRIVENRDVSTELEFDANLAEMPWEDFEHLVRQLFEWEFGKNGIEVKVTRASRDRGVDAIMFDPDPLRGGKYVLQAKRYTRLVDVAAVRDLYGTVVNEGANRGILVTTSSFGPDSYDFAKDKPLSLVDGPNLIAMLRRHGRNYRIDLDEARKSKI